MTSRSRKDPRVNDFVDEQNEIKQRLRNLAVGSHITPVSDGAYGRNRDWAKMTLRPGCSITHGGFMRWCIVSNEVIIEASGGKLDLTGVFPDPSTRSGFQPVTIAKIHKHGWPGSHHNFRTPLASGGTSSFSLLQMSPLGELLLTRPVSWRDPYTAYYGSQANIDYYAPLREQSRINTVTPGMVFEFRMVYPLG